jgi:hypothetical protein
MPRLRLSLDITSHALELSSGISTGGRLVFWGDLTSLHSFFRISGKYVGIR